MITEAMGEAATALAAIWFLVTLFLTAAFIDKKASKIVHQFTFFIVIVFPSLLAMFGVVALILNAK
jgi:hypothetical protein